MKIINLHNLQLRSDSASESSGLILAAVGDDFDCALASAMYHARDIALNSAGTSTPLSKELKSLDDDIKPEWLEEWYDGLGYCE